MLGDSNISDTISSLIELISQLRRICIHKIAPRKHKFDSINNRANPASQYQINSNDTDIQLYKFMMHKSVLIQS